MSAAPATPRLERTLGVRDVALFMVTAGCSPQWAAMAATSGPSSLVIWLLGGLGMFVPLSVCIVFLSSRHPDEGGLYVWAKRAFGPFGGFMTGWTYWIANLVYLPGLFYFAAGSALYWSGPPDPAAGASSAYFIGFSGVALAFAVWLNRRGLRYATWLNNAGAVARWLEALLLVALAIVIYRRFGPAVVIDRHSVMPGFRLADWIFWGTIAFAWTGVEAASFMGGEIRDPRRTVPRGLAIAAPIIAAVYLLGTAAVLLSVPLERLSALYGVMEAISSSAGRLGLGGLVPLGALLVVVDRVASVGLWMGASARIPFVAGVDRYLPKRFAELHPAYGTPTVALWTQTAIVAAFVVLGQAGTTVKDAYNVLVEMIVAATMLPFLPLFGAAIRLSGGPKVPGEAWIPGGRATVVAMALLGLATTIAAMGFSLVPAADEKHPLLAVLKVAVTTIVLLLTGAVIYVTGRARAQRRDELAAPRSPAGPSA